TRPSPLSLHDALPIYDPTRPADRARDPHRVHDLPRHHAAVPGTVSVGGERVHDAGGAARAVDGPGEPAGHPADRSARAQVLARRSEEHTSELQSRENI